MKFLKNTLAFFIPLTAMLIAFTLYLLTNNIVNSYKIKISKDYSIVIITNTPLVKDTIDELAGIKIEKIETLRKENIINNIKSDLSKSSIELLKRKLPNFYQIYLETFPTTNELTEIKDTLYQNKNIRNVEVFSKDHNQIYLLLLLLNSISFILFFIILIFAIIIISKQIKLWFYEHKVKISILRLHGASILYSSSSVLKYAIFSSVMASVIVSFLLYYLSNNLSIIFPNEIFEIINTPINVKAEIFKIFFLSFGISIFTILGVLLKYKITND